MHGNVNFHNLPRELLSVLVNDWLEWKDVTHWDTAICNNIDRTEWLDMLKSNRIVPMIIIGHNFSSTVHSWFVARNMRTRKMIIGNYALKDETATISWLRNTSSFIKEVSFQGSGQVEPIESLVAQLCNGLAALCFCEVRLENTHWNVIRNNPELKELYIFGYIHDTMIVPADISFPTLDKLSIRWSLFDNDSVSALIRRLPMLRSLSVNWYYEYDIYNCLRGACPNLVHLELEEDFIERDNVDDEALAQLLESMETGLRCLVLPGFTYFSPRELRAIAQYHGHSLRCLSFCNIEDLDKINSYPNLHTLLVTIYFLKGLVGSVINTNINHLYVDMMGSDVDHLPEGVFKHFPALTTLSLKYFFLPDVQDPTPLLNLPHHIHTVHVDKADRIPFVSKMIPNVVIGNDGVLDVFSTDF